AHVEARAVAGELPDFLKPGEPVVIALRGLPRVAQQLDHLAVDDLAFARWRVLFGFVSPDQLIHVDVTAASGLESFARLGAAESVDDQPVLSEPGHQRREIAVRT